MHAQRIRYHSPGSKATNVSMRFIRMFAYAIVTLFMLSAGLRAESGNPVLARLGGDFTLEGAHGRTSLSEFKGKVVLIYFGYTRCPDICPTTLAAMAAAIERLSEARRVQVQPLFISLDPQRDTPESLAKYVEYFYPGMRGLTGSPERLDKVARDYGVSYQKVDDASSALGYTLDHSAYIYVLDRNGRISALIPHGSTAEGILARIEACLDQR